MSIRNIFCILAASGLTTATLWAQGFSPEEAVQRMQVPPGLTVVAEFGVVSAETPTRRPVRSASSAAAAGNMPACRRPAWSPAAAAARGAVAG